MDYKCIQNVLEIYIELLNPPSGVSHNAYLARAFGLAWHFSEVGRAGTCKKSATRIKNCAQKKKKTLEHSRVSAREFKSAYEKKGAHK